MNYLVYSLVFLLLPNHSLQTDEQSEINYGVLIGKFNIYHHGVGGDVYAVNTTTFFIKNFNYDGMGKDTYFWAGVDNQPGMQGFIVPDRYGRTNVLRKSDNEDFTLTLPDGKSIGEIKWLAVYDLKSFQNFGDVYIPDGFEPPGVAKLTMTIRSDDISCDQVLIMDLKCLIFERLYVFAEDKELYFWVGKGHVPSTRGTKVPDELGYLDPLRNYGNEDVKLVLPGEFTFNNIDWLSVYDAKTNTSLGYISFPNELNVPPNLRQVIKYENTVPKCEQLHANLQIGWDIVGQTITFEIVGLVSEDDWLGFGVSGSENKSNMIGSDVAIAFMKNQVPVVHDYKIDARAPCSSVLDVHRGVCKDVLTGGSDSYQVLEGRRVGPLTVIKYRRQLTKSDENDKEYSTSSPAPIIWAVGKLMDNGEPGFHRIWSKNIKYLKLDRTGEDERNCMDFIIGDDKIKPWETTELRDRNLRMFSARLGPSGGDRGYEGMKKTGSPGYAWYIQGFIVPDMFMQRGITYSFKVEGGNNPHHLEIYHPFIITNEPVGGPNAAPNKQILAGVEITRRGQNRPTAAGRLCLWRHEQTDRHTDSAFTTFESYRNKLKMRCENGSEPAILSVTPNSSWPDIVYYHSYVQPNMGSKIHIVDNLYGYDYDHSTSKGARSVSSSSSSYLIFISVLHLLTVAYRYYYV